LGNVEPWISLGAVDFFVLRISLKATLDFLCFFEPFEPENEQIERLLFPQYNSDKVGKIRGESETRGDFNH
jgi:hypothetical protein